MLESVNTLCLCVGIVQGDDQVLFYISMRFKPSLVNEELPVSKEDWWCIIVWNSLILWPKQSPLALFLLS